MVMSVIIFKSKIACWFFTKGLVYPPPPKKKLKEYIFFWGGGGEDKTSSLVEIQHAILNTKVITLQCSRPSGHLKNNNVGIF